MEVLINNQTAQINEEATLNEALNTMHITQYNGVAIAVNEQVVPQPHWPVHKLNPGDRILIIRATQGG